MSKIITNIPLGEVTNETDLNDKNEIIDSMSDQQVEHFMLLYDKIVCSRNYLIGCILEDAEKNVPYREKYNVCQEGLYQSYKINSKYSIGRLILWVFGVKDEFIKDYLMRDVTREQVENYYYRFIKNVLKRQKHNHIPEYISEYISENTLEANSILDKNVSQMVEYMKSLQLI